jgi:hypothetical protein
MAIAKRSVNTILAFSRRSFAMTCAGISRQKTVVNLGMLSVPEDDA